MKRIALLLILVLFCLPASAHELTNLTFDELIDLRDQVTQEITSRPEWKEVIVPAGVYTIGIDIPAGHWTLSIADTDYFSCTYGSALNLTKTGIDYSDSLSILNAGKKGTSLYDIYGTDSVSVEIETGNYLVIAGSCVFSSYIRPALGF